MDIFHHSAQLIDEWQKLATAIREGHTPCEVTGVSAIHKAHFIAALNQELSASHGATLVITEDEASANRLCDDINCMLSADIAVVYPAKDFNLTPVEVSSHEYEHKRIGVLSNLCTGKPAIVIAGIEAALQLTIPKDKLEQFTLTIKKDEELQTANLANNLISAGYSRTELVEGAGQFSLRGQIVDIFPVSEKNPVRIELWGDEIDQLNYFDVQTQRRGESLKKISIPPAQEVLFSTPLQAIESIEAFAKTIKG
ncbi:MAG TPA: transcription-repair coupling factor, partial [Oscillospiraceae bacterium]|nr:transcription-repair coupling factor [Oscillospiraceae bacterium]